MSKISNQKDIVTLNLKHLNFWSDQLFENSFELDKVIITEMIKSADIFMTDLKTLRDLHDEKE